METATAAAAAAVVAPPPPPLAAAPPGAPLFLLAAGSPILTSREVVAAAAAAAAALSGSGVIARSSWPSGPRGSVRPVAERATAEGRELEAKASNGFSRSANVLFTKGKPLGKLA